MRRDKRQAAPKNKPKKKGKKTANKDKAAPVDVMQDPRTAAETEKLKALAFERKQLSKRKAELKEVSAVPSGSPPSP